MKYLVNRGAWNEILAANSIIQWGVFNEQGVHCFPNWFYILLNVVFGHVPEESVGEDVFCFIVARFIRYW